MSASDWTATLDPPPQTLTVTGGSQIDGEVEVFGSKKGMPKILLAAMLTDEPCCLDAVSWIDDLAVSAMLLEAVGRVVDLAGRKVTITSGVVQPSDLRHALLPVAAVSRVPILSAGPQLARFGEAWVPALGGDRIGARSVGMHIELLRRMGATVTIEDRWIRATAPVLRGARVQLPYPMVSVTEHALLAAAMAVGRSEIRNAAVDPEIQELAGVLGKMGVRVALDTERRTVIVDGSRRTSGFSHVMGRDRIEAGSWASLALASGGDVLVRGVTDRDMGGFLNLYRAAGGGVHMASDGIRFTGTDAKRAQVRIESGPYPAFETDWHPPLMAALTQAHGTFSIHETLFEDRFNSVAALREMGADIDLRVTCGPSAAVCRMTGRRHLAVVRGPRRLSGADSALPDLRGGFALLIAALVSQGDSTLAGTEILQRGYEQLIARLQMIGGVVHVAR